MNNRQRMLTYATAALVGLMGLCVPWDLTDGIGHSPTTKFSPIFWPPDYMYWKHREVATSVFWTWAWIGGVYGLVWWGLRDSPERVADSEGVVRVSQQ